MTLNSTLLYVASSSDKFHAGFSQDDAQGIYVYRLESNTGELKFIGVSDAVPSAQYLTIAPSGRFLYATHFHHSAPEGEGGQVNAFAIHPTTGQLNLLNQLPTRGDSPCYITTDRAGDIALSVNYAGIDGLGSVCAFPVQADGHLGEMLTYMQHEGASVNPDRQTCSHPHMLMTDPRNELVLVPDLGIDRVVIYRLNQGKLIPAEVPFLPIQPGAGPRHLIFHSKEPYMYLINELDNTITAFHYQGASFEELETVSTLPDGYDGISYAADIHIEPSGRFLYGSNRGHNSISVYEINQSTGHLTYVSHHNTGGEWPRSFAIDPTGQFLIVANQRSHDLFVFRIDQEQGTLDLIQNRTEVPAPFCVKPLIIR